jgi:hypothetical protein
MSGIKNKKKVNDVKSLHMRDPPQSIKHPLPQKEETPHNETILEKNAQNSPSTALFYFLHLEKNNENKKSTKKQLVSPSNSDDETRSDGKEEEEENLVITPRSAINTPSALFL